MIVDYSPERRQQVIAHLRDYTCCLRDLTPQARELNTVALLICDPDGAVSHSDLVAAYGDPSARQAARSILAKAGL